MFSFPNEYGFKSSTKITHFDTKYDLQLKEVSKSLVNSLFLRNVGMNPLFNVKSLILKESYDY